MKVSSFEAIARAFGQAGVRYLVAGGLAVNAHGYLRLTFDVDLVIQLDASNIKAAFDALGSLGYRPAVPVTATQFADARLRREWIEQKRMQVLNFHSDRHRETSVDVFATEPFDFEKEYAASLSGEIAPGVPVRFVSIPTLIAMKEVANRPRDRDDIQHLQWLLEDRKGDGRDA